MIKLLLQHRPHHVIHCGNVQVCFHLITISNMEEQTLSTRLVHSTKASSSNLNSFKGIKPNVLTFQPTNIAIVEVQEYQQELFPLNHSTKLQSLHGSSQIPLGWGLYPLLAKINVIFLKSKNYRFFFVDLQVFFPIVKVCMFLAFQGDIGVTTIDFMNCIVIHTCSISHKPMEIRLKQTNSHQLFIQACLKQALRIEVFYFHLTQHNGQQMTTKRIKHMCQKNVQY